MGITFNNNKDLNYIYRATSGGTAFSSNLASSAVFDYFNDSPAVNDALYFGIESPLYAWKDLLFYVGTAMAGTYTLVWEYYTTSWQTLTVVDNTNSFKASGQKSVTFSVPGNWNTVAVNSKSCMWLRVRISAITSVTEGGAQSTQKVQAGNFALMVTGYSDATPASLTDIYNADISGGWGMITSQGTQFRILCNLQIGDGATASYFVSKNEHLEILGGVWVTVNGYFSAGELIDLAARTTKNGSAIRFTGTYAKSYYRFLGNATCYFYGSLLTVNSYLYFFGRMINCTCTGATLLNYADSVNTIISRVTLERSGNIALDALSAVYEDVFVHNSDRVIWVSHGLSERTVRNLRARNNTYLFRNGGTSGSYPFNFIDADVDAWTFYWGTVPASGYYVAEKYSINLKILDKNNIPVQGATVKLVNQGGTQQFSLSTAADGTIAEQIVLAKKYEWQSGTAPGVTTTTDYGPFTLTISKSGYRTYKTRFTLNKKTDWKICLRVMQPVFE